MGESYYRSAAGVAKIVGLENKLMKMRGSLEDTYREVKSKLAEAKTEEEAVEMFRQCELIRLIAFRMGVEL